MLVYLKERLALGRKRYGHGVRVDMDTCQWGTKENSWLEMAREEALDGIIYVLADYIKTHLPNRSARDDDNDYILYLWNHREEIKSEKHVDMLKNFTKILINTF